MRESGMSNAKMGNRYNNLSLLWEPWEESIIRI